jgi:transposase
MRIRFDRATWQACEGCAVCPWANDAPRQVTVRSQAPQEVLQAARQRQQTEECKGQYALRAGVESSLSHGGRRFALRQSRSIGLARTHLPQPLNATAMKLVRVVDWFRRKPGDDTKRPPGRLARLAPDPSANEGMPSARAS